MLEDTTLEPNFPLRHLANRSVGLSGSDLRELCRNAAMLPVREYVRQTATNEEALAKGQLEVRIHIPAPSFPHRTRLTVTLSYRGSNCVHSDFQISTKWTV